MKRRHCLLMILVGGLLFFGGLTGFIMTLRSSLAEENDSTLYSAVAEDPLTEVYSGEHQDSLDNSGTSTIHYFTGSDDIVNHNNVKLGNTCWQILRTTDTGGVKMIYNGLYDETNKCNSSRESHKGLVAGTSESIDLSGGEYLYGDITYNESTGEFTLINTTSATWSNSTYSGLLGKYTCASSSNTCTTVYNINAQKSSTNAQVTSYTVADTNYAQIGTSQFNAYSGAAMVGYMRRSPYSFISSSRSCSGERVLLTSSDMFKLSQPYGVDISYNNGRYTLASPRTISSPSQLANKYAVNGSGSIIGDTAYYIVYAGSSNSTYFTNVYYLSLTGGEPLAGANKFYVYGDSYSGTKITGSSYLNSTDFYSRHSNINKKYYCTGDSTSASCSPKYAVSTTGELIYYLPTSGAYKYGSGVTYSNGTYSLTGVITGFPNDNHHYTCFSTGTTCQTVYYVSYFGGSSSATTTRIALDNGKTIASAVTDMYDSSSVNTYNSSIKSQIESWYSQNMTNYTKYLEDAVYCTDRTRTNQSESRFNPSGSLSQTMYFSDRDNNTTLKCTRATDRFAVANNRARNKYPVGLATYAEMNLLDNEAARNTGENYWLGSPCSVSNATNNSSIGSTGDLTYASTNTIKGTRPVVSLKAGTEYVSGTGSQTDPYVIDVRPTITTSVEHGTITETTKVEVGSNKTINYSPDSGYELKSIKVDGESISISTYENSYTFSDITEDHTIEVEYWKPTITTKVKNGTITETSDVDKGSNKTINYSPDSGYRLISVKVDGVSLDIDTYPNSYTFTNITEDHTIEVEYWKPTITTQVTNGTITATSDVDAGSNKTVEYTPDTGYRLESIKVDGVNVDPSVYPSSYTFTNVTTDHTIDVVFTLKKVGYKVNYLENGTDKVLYPQKVEENAYYGEEIISIEEMIDIDNYHYVGAEHDRVVLGNDSDDNVINLYYELNSKEEVIVGHNMKLTSDTSKITSEKDKIDYQIQYRVGLNNYVGKAKVEVVDYLPYQIDLEKSNLDGGTYNKDYRTITWKGTVDIDDANNQISFDKSISLVYKGYDLSKKDLTNVAVGNITLKALDDYNEEVYDTKTISVDIKKKEEKKENNSSGSKTNTSTNINSIVRDRVNSPNTTTRNMYLYIIIMMISLGCFIFGIKSYKKIKS